MKPSGSWLHADLLILIAMAIFGSYALFLRLAPDIPSLTFLFAGQITGAIGFYFVGRVYLCVRLTRRDLGYYLALAVVGVGLDLTAFVAYRLTDVANVALGQQSVSIFLLVLAPIFLGERTTRREWIALVPSLAGLVLVYWGKTSLSRADLAGCGLALVAGLLYAILIILYRVIPDARRGVTVHTASFWRYAFSTLLMLPLLPFMRLGSLDAADIGVLAGFGTLFLVLGTMLYIIGVERTRAVHASIIGKTLPVFAIVYAFAFLDEAPSTTAIIGGALILGASIWLAVQRE
ncbi:MAG: DMT family transporter [Kofleriaceae bacterium]